MMSSNNKNNFHIGCGYTVKQIIENYNKILEKKIKTEIGIRRPGDSKSVVANSNKFYQKFMWKPKYNNLQYILNTALQWEKKN